MEIWTVHIMRVKNKDLKFPKKMVGKKVMSAGVVRDLNPEHCVSC
jgi:hypothetical protein